MFGLKSCWHTKCCFLAGTELLFPSQSLENSKLSSSFTSSVQLSSALDTEET